MLSLKLGRSARSTECKAQRKRRRKKKKKKKKYGEGREAGDMSTYRVPTSD
jgi:hypothetical protein